jgi:alpha-galactosidase
MSPDQRALVAQAVAVYKRIRADIPGSTPFWPLGLPGWTDPWIALGLRAPDTTYLTVWHRDAHDSSNDQAHNDNDATRVLTMAHLRGRRLAPRVLYPEASATADAVRWDPDSGELTVHLPRPVTACLVALADTDRLASPVDGD